MFLAKNAHSFFPTLVWTFDLSPAQLEPVNRKIWPVIDAMRPSVAADSSGRTRQSDSDLQERVEFEALGKLLVRAGMEVVDFLGVQRHDLFVSGCWVNFGATNTTHHEHSHANNFLSAVYYLQAEKGADTINFIDPRPQAHVIAPPVVRPSALTASQVVVEIKPGRLILFPAWLRHSVDPNTSGMERISIAANLMFKQFSERLARPRFKGNLDRDRRRGTGTLS